MCWNDLCIASDCDGNNHVDATGSTWRQKRGEAYCPACDDYVTADTCIHMATAIENERLRGPHDS